MCIVTFDRTLASLPRLVAIALAVLSLTGCNKHLERKMPEHPVMPVMYEARPVNGSIFGGMHQAALFEDLTARQVGDIVTVALEEKTDARKKASASADQSSDLSVKTPTVFGKVFSNLGDGQGVSTGIDTEKKFSGKGAADQSNSFSGDITAVVTHVYPNGHLRIEGEKFITLNDGDEVIRISGIIRQVDISPDNTVRSTQVGNATIVYTGGNSPSHEASIPSLVTKFFFTALSFL